MHLSMRTGMSLSVCKKRADTKMRKYANVLEKQWALLDDVLQSHHDLNINHAVMLVTLLQINANDTVIRKEISIKDPVHRINSGRN